MKSKEMKKRLFKILDKHGVFEATKYKYIRSEYKQSLFKDILKLIQSKE
jgi:hypothetical protein